MKFIKILALLILSILFLNCLKNKIESDKEEITSNVNDCLVTFITGKASIIDESDKWLYEIKAGDLLTENDILKTEKESTVELQIGKNSIIRIKESSKVKILSLFNDQKTTNTKVNLEFGKIYAKSEKLNTGSIFEIQTKSITAGVRGTEFIVYVPEKDRVIVAVNEGKVTVEKNIKLNEINNLKIINTQLAEKIENSVKSDIILKENEKVEIDNKTVEDYGKKVDGKITEIIDNLVKNKDSVEKINSVIAEAQKVTVSAIKSESNKIMTKGKITEKEWEIQFDKKEFNEMNIKQTEEKKPMENTSEKEEKKAEKKDDKSEAAKVEKESKEEEREAINIIEKLPKSLETTFSEKATSITTNGRNVLVANDVDNTIYCVNPADGSIIWKFRDEKLTKIQSSAIGYKNSIIIASYSDIFVLSGQGKLILNRSISNGPSFWANPILFGNFALIPTARTIYYYNGTAIEQLDESVFPAANSQLYISSNDPNFIYIVESLSKIVKVFDFTKKELIWTSDNLNDISFSHAVRSGQYLVASDISSYVYRFNFINKDTKPEILNVSTGIISDIVSIGSSVYFIGKNGWLYKLNVNTFNSALKIVKLDDKPDQDKYLIKKLVKKGSKLYYACDNGSLFIYDTKAGSHEFVKSQKSMTVPLVSSPVIINDNIYVYDMDSNLYVKKEIFK
ncbi:MAG: FecR domain-containing protein [Spirochaetes bacterium]|nr:FecR domain-containing protein [Spirochaetota bacterium]